MHLKITLWKKFLTETKLIFLTKKIYAKDDYYYPITKEEKDLININYKIKDKKNTKMVKW